MITDTAIRAFSKLFAADTNAGSITAPIPTITAPAAGDNGFLPMLDGNAAAFVFYGTRTSVDNETFTAQITAWSQVGALWIPVPLLSLALIQGTPIGIAGQTVIATEFFADTITLTTAWAAAATYEINNPANNTIGMVKIDAFGAQFLQVQLAKGTNATCNALGRTF